MATEQPVAPVMQNGTQDSEKSMEQLDKAMNNTNLQTNDSIPNGDTNGLPNGVADHNQKSAAANGHINPPELNAVQNSVPQVDGAFTTEPTVPEDTLKLPHSSSDGLIKTPLAAPLETSKPTLRPDLSADQKTKFSALLKNVQKWTELPQTAARGAANAPLTDGERMFLTRECLLRYLRASTWIVSTAETRLKNTLVWRREYGLEKITPDYISIESETGKQVILGWDIEGRPCQYMRPSKQNTERSPRQIRHLVFMLERSVDMMPSGQETLALLINFAETKSGQGATLSQGRETLNILQNHYPERLGRALVTNVPFYIWGFFKLITPFIDPLTREKIKFNEDSGIHVPREQLLKESGGFVEFEYEHASYWTALNELCDIKRKNQRIRWEKAGKRIGELEVYLRGGQEKSLSDVEKEE